jgi:hypothetical protein
MRNLSGKSFGEIKTHILFGNFFFLEKRSVYEIMWKIQYSRAGYRWQCGACALQGGQKHTLRICNA